MKLKSHLYYAGVILKYDGIIASITVGYGEQKIYYFNVFKY